MAESNEGLPLRQLVSDSFRNATEHGFWSDADQQNIPSKLALIHSEISEALESYRDPQADAVIKVPVEIVEGLLSAGQEFDASLDVLASIYEKWKSKPKGFDIEIADAFIRLADLAGHLNIDIESAIRAKQAYNAGREYRHGRRV